MAGHGVRATQAGRSRAAMWAAIGGGVLAFALWLPWFDRRVSGVFVPLQADQTLSGWRALGGLAGLVLALALVALVWAGLRSRDVRATQAQPRPSALWLVLAGGIALIVVMSVTVERVGGQDLPCCESVTSTTAPSAGLALAYGGALAIILVGLIVLVQEARHRSQER